MIRFATISVCFRKCVLMMVPLGLIMACGGEEERQEVLSKLRGLGVSGSPFVSKPSVAGEVPEFVTLTLMLSVPPDQAATVTVKPFTDQAGAIFQTLKDEDYEIGVPTPRHTFRDLHIVEVPVKVKVPDDKWFAMHPSGGQLRYSLEVTTSNDQEKLVGTFLLFKDGQADAGLTAALTVNLNLPADQAELTSGEHVPLSATVSKADADEVKVGWFVTGGEIDNRRAKETRWKVPESGEHTVIVTVRGKKSRGFHYDFRTVISR